MRSAPDSLLNLASPIQALADYLDKHGCKLRSVHVDSYPDLLRHDESHSLTVETICGTVKVIDDIHQAWLDREETMP